MEADRLRRGLTRSRAKAFPLREVRLPDRAAWDLLRKTRSRVRAGELELRWIAPAPDGAFRLAVSVRKRNGTAPLRNRLRRQLRELARSRRDELGAVWLHWSFPPRKLGSPTAELRSAAMELLRRAGLVQA